MSATSDVVDATQFIGDLRHREQQRASLPHFSTITDMLDDGRDDVAQRVNALIRYLSKCRCPSVAPDLAFGRPSAYPGGTRTGLSKSTEDWEDLMR